MSHVWDVSLYGLVLVLAFIVIQAHTAPVWLNDPSSVYFRVSRLPESSSDVKNLKSIERIFGTAETDLLRHRLKFFQSGTGVQIPYLLNGSALTTGAYSIAISLGSPPQQFNVVVDTGSDLLWVPCQCLQCATSSAFLPLNPPFDPYSSSTVVVPDCTGSLCSQMTSYYGESVFGCTAEDKSLPNYEPSNLTANYCQYKYGYGGGYFTSGLLLEDKFSFTANSGEQKSTSVLFGCGRVQSGLLSSKDFGFDGLIGLGRNWPSLPLILSSNGLLPPVFSLCLEGAGDGGHLALGKKGLPPSALFVPLPTNPASGYWALSVAEMAMGTASITFSSPGSALPVAIWDSGTTFTFLPPKVFSYLQSLVTVQLGTSPLTSEAASNLTCYRLDASLTVNDIFTALTPLSITFQYGNDSASTATLVVPVFNLFELLLNWYPNGDSVVCFTALPSSEIFIIGETWLRNLLISFDAQDNLIGWIHLNCTSGRYLDPLTAQEGSEVLTNFADYPPPGTQSTPPEGQSSPSPPSVSISPPPLESTPPSPPLDLFASPSPPPAPSVPPPPPSSPKSPQVPNAPSPPPLTLARRPPPPSQGLAFAPNPSPGTTVVTASSGHRSAGLTYFISLICLTVIIFVLSSVDQVRGF